MTEGSIEIKEDNKGAKDRDITVNGEPVVVEVNGLKFTIKNMDYKDRRSHRAKLLDTLPDGFFEAVKEEGIEDLKGASKEQQAKVSGKMSMVENAVKTAEYTEYIVKKYCSGVSAKSGDYSIDDIFNSMDLDECIDDVYDEILCLSGLREKEAKAL
ncbi:MAG: hypothetical protein GY775_15065 [Candidatus Scalindua sp.]|jgi:hypothetical protein|nr:hypothetical protein [Candidatus Scalindua sp.]